MRLGSLLPFATLGVAIFVVSSAALLSTARDGIRGGPAPTTTPTADATPRAVPELSKTARIAYWRDGRLWVSGLDGSLRRGVTQVDDLRRVSALRWSFDGEKIAFLDAGLALVIVRTDGTRRDVSLPLVIRDQGWRIADIRWSPDSRRIAATFLQPGDGRADAFVTDISIALPTWTQVTQMNDLFVGDWTSDTELLASTAGGVIATVEVPQDLATPPHGNAVRPISGALGTSPIIASDGRIHFLAGRVPTSRDPSLPYITATRASVWSAAADGSDVRRETLTELNDVRLDGRLPDGRYLVHRGATSAQSVTGEDVEPLPANGGVIERVRLAPDGRTAYGFTRERIVRFDITKVGVTAPASPTAAATVFLDTNGEADVWFPSQAKVARGGEAPPKEPAALYAFSLGGHLWQMGPDGRPALLRPGSALRRTSLPVPRWSPTGEHLLALEQAGFGAPTTALIAVTIDSDGEQTRIADTYAAARSFAWAPKGAELAVVVDRRGVNGTASNAQLEVRFFDPSGKSTRTPVPGNEVAWTSRGILVMGEVSGAHVIQLIADGGAARTLVTRDRLTGDPRVVASPSLGTVWNTLDARPDASLVSLRLQTADGSAGYFVLLGSDGAPVEFLRGDNLTDPAWSPAKPLIGYTLDLRTANERAVVHEPGSGPLAIQDGRFAGWTPDGAWYYVARTAGLFAYPVAGGSGLRVGPFGAPAAVTTAR